jgi:hypothetical protein
MMMMMMMMMMIIIIIIIIMERCTLWSTLKFQRCSLRHIMGDDFSWATKRITNAIMISKATMISKVIVVTMS